MTIDYSDKNVLDRYNKMSEYLGKNGGKYVEKSNKTNSLWLIRKCSSILRMRMDEKEGKSRSRKASFTGSLDVLLLANPKRNST